MEWGDNVLFTNNVEVDACRVERLLDLPGVSTSNVTKSDNASHARGLPQAIVDSVPYTTPCKPVAVCTTTRSLAVSMTAYTGLMCMLAASSEVHRNENCSSVAKKASISLQVPGLPHCVGVRLVVLSCPGSAAALCMPVLVDSMASET